MSNYEVLARRLKALGHPVRLAIFDAVRRHCCLGLGSRGEVRGCPVGNLYEVARVSPSTVSHHLRELKACGLLEERRSGTFLYLTPGHAATRSLFHFARDLAADLDRLCGEPRPGGCCGPPAAASGKASPPAPSRSTRPKP